MFDQILSIHGIGCHPHRSKPDEFWICCPFCVGEGESPDRRFRLGVNVKSGLAHCYNCEWSSRGRGTVDKILTALGIGTGLLEIVSDPPVPEKSKLKEEEEPGLPAEFVPLEESDEEGQVAWEYLRGRNVSPKQIEKYGIGYALAGRFAYRILFPVWVGKKIGGVVGRDYTGKQTPPYLNSRGVARGVFNLHRVQQGQAIVMVEGVMDCLSVERVGYRAVAPLGRILDDEQLALIRKKHVSSVTILIDWDKDGISSAQETAQKLLSLEIPVKIARPVDGMKDAGAMLREQVHRSLYWATPWTLEASLRHRMQFAEERL